MLKGCCPGKMPSLASMARDLSTTAINAIRMAIKNGDIIADEATVTKRLSVCNQCSYKTGMRCVKCGCYISLKSGIAAATCPENKW